VTSYPSGPYSVDLPYWARQIISDRGMEHPRWPSSPATVPVKRPSHEEIQQKVANFKLVADALELLLAVWPEIPGASVTLTPAQQDELKRIILALPASVAL
jgi:hypothetical protein